LTVDGQPQGDISLFSEEGMNPMAAIKPVGYAVIGLGGFAQGAILPGFGHSKKAKLVALVSGDKS
jgi:hypothetical protein